MENGAKKSNYALYIQERENKSIVEDERGFATYFYLEDAVYIEDIFVKREFRKQGVASEYADKIAEEARSKNFFKMLGTVSPKANGSTNSLKALLAYGFKLDSSDNNVIYLTKDLGAMEGFNG
jgi:predicted GNAT family acetyltransferase